MPRAQDAQERLSQVANNSTRTRQSFRVLLTPLTYVHVGKERLLQVARNFVRARPFFAPAKTTFPPSMVVVCRGRKDAQERLSRVAKTFTRTKMARSGVYQVTIGIHTYRDTSTSVYVGYRIEEYCHIPTIHGGRIEYAS